MNNISSKEKGARTGRTGQLFPLLVLSAPLLTCSLVLSGCGQEKSDKDHKPTTVGYVVIKTTNSPVISELSGRTSAYQMSDVRPQVSGVIRRRFFTEGALVKQGQPLYEIDPSLYQAAAGEAQANLDSALANAVAKSAQADRLKPLAKIQAVAQQDYTDAAAAARQATAAVAQTRAVLDTARINLHYTTVPAPISGRIGRSLYTVGALVTLNQTNALAQITQLDPMYVDIQQSSADLLALRRTLAKGGAAPSKTDVRLTLEDGSEYPATGEVQFTEAIVDPGTGTVTLRARFPNAQYILLPGMFVRARFTQAIDRQVMLVPQTAVSRDPTGAATLFVVGAGDKAEQRTITAIRTDGTNWVVTQGLKPGDRVITQGLATLKAGQAVKAVPADTPQNVTPSGSQDGKAHGGA
jgi:membrane fusion protein (multidrug efflux system)